MTLSQLPIGFVGFILITAFLIIGINKSIQDADKNEILKEAERKRKIINESEEITKKYSKNLWRERFSNSLTDAYGIRRYDK
mgnify:CR=1 FL=1